MQGLPLHSFSQTSYFVLCHSPVPMTSGGGEFRLTSKCFHNLEFIIANLLQEISIDNDGNSSPTPPTPLKHRYTGCLNTRRCLANTSPISIPLYIGISDTSKEVGRCFPNYVRLTVAFRENSNKIWFSSHLFVPLQAELL